jgi:ribA/ribD-fused uncharacterized protein
MQNPHDLGAESAPGYDAPVDVPLDLQTLCDAVRAGRRFSYRSFWGHQAPRGRLTDACFSQWWPSPFAVDGHTFPTAEHFMMFAKARLFGDDPTAERVLTAASPRLAKDLGREVKGFSEERWAALRFDVVTVGNLAKFEQTPALGAHLLGTGEAVLVEASPDDLIWGIGLHRGEEGAGDPLRWRGLNLLGFAVTRARRLLTGHEERPELPFAVR